MSGVAEDLVGIPMIQPADFRVTVWIWNHLDSTPQKRVDIPSAQILSECQEPWSGPLRIMYVTVSCQDSSVR